MSSAHPHRPMPSTPPRAARRAAGPARLASPGTGRGARAGDPPGGTGPTRLALPALALLAVALPATTLQADVFVVAPGASIQAALDVAGPGDVVRVSAGTYTELLSIGTGRDGLVLEGKGKVVIDQLPPPSEGARVPGLSIASSSVVVRRLTLRHAAGTAIAATEPGLSGLLLDRVEVVNPTGTAIDLLGDGHSLVRCRVVGAGDRGIVIEGQDALVSRNTVEQCAADGIVIDGDQAEVSRNVVDQVRGDNGIDVFGNGALVSRNTVFRTDDSAITLDGDDAVVEKNQVQGVCSDAGVRVQGNHPVVSGNRISGVLDGQDTLRVVSLGGSGVVDGNVLSDGTGTGLSLSGDAVLVSGNTITACGVDAFGLEVAGNLNIIDLNRILRSHADGLRLDGNANVLTANSVLDGYEDGIVVGSGAANVLDGNLVKNNQSEGVENGGTGTVLRDNRILKNRIDLVNDTDGGATLVLESGNVIGDGSDGSDEPEV